MTSTFNWAQWCASSRWFASLDMTLRGCSQVMFQNNPLTGLLFFIAIFMGAYGEGLPQVAFGCLLGTVVATGSAALIVTDRSALRAGLFGYNGCLIGAALPTFLSMSTLLWVSITLGGLLSVIVTLALSRLLKLWKLAVLTAPFVFTTWSLLLASYAFSHLNPAHLPLAAMPSSVPEHAGYLSLSEIVTGTLQGVSQVFLFSNVASGVLLLLGLGITSRWAMALGFLGALLATLIAGGLGADPHSISAGLYAFSAVLTAIALGSVFNRPGWRVLIYTLLGVIFTVVAQGAFNTLLTPLGIPSLTMPFVLVCWLLLLANPKIISPE
ncbi:urea transporter [Serratia silvae]|uniref:Urea transporter n=1 Tax=Serratia silvae TaxID=2824122 RepID=A0ABT0K8E7_9GAMM|nr:urea transporter [Serratia silvae]MCL1028300.1 urea transporter [Serratia silvae]